MRAIKLVEHAVVWIPYGWVTILVSCTGQIGSPVSLVIPYLSPKLALTCSSIGLLVNFNLELNEARAAGQYGKDDAASYAEWLGPLNPQEESQLGDNPPSGQSSQPTGLGGRGT